MQLSYGLNDQVYLDFMTFIDSQMDYLKLSVEAKYRSSVC